jgi:copper chaperone CopZ
MKTLVFILTFISSTVFAAVIEVKIDGMVCSMCAQGIQKKFKNHASIKDLRVDMDQKLVHLTTHDHLTLNDSTITQLIIEAGYNVAKIERK